MRADPDDLSARVHAVRLALLCDPSPLAAVLADLLLAHCQTVLEAERVSTGRLSALGQLVAAAEVAVSDDALMARYKAGHVTFNQARTVMGLPRVEIPEADEPLPAVLAWGNGFSKGFNAALA